MKMSIALAGLASGLIAATAGHAAPVAAAPAAQSFTLGALTVVALRDALNVVPNDSSVFGTNTSPEAVSAVLAHAGAPTASITLGVDALLVKGSGRIVLIDTGLGPKVNGMLPASLAAARVNPDQVTDVLITHGHQDHTGGLLTAGGGSAFPRAAIHISAAEWAAVKGDARNAKLVAAVATQVRTFAPGTEVVPGILAIAAPGHTPGHTLYEISSRGQKLLDIGDSAHSSIVSLAEPAWMTSYDDDAGTAAEAREGVLARAAAAHELVFAPHFPFPGIGRITGGNGHYQWQPDVPAQ